jgi:hypothetical protein
MWNIGNVPLTSVIWTILTEKKRQTSNAEFVECSKRRPQSKFDAKAGELYVSQRGAVYQESTKHFKLDLNVKG